MQGTLVAGKVLIVDGSSTFRSEVGACLAAHGVSVFGEGTDTDLAMVSALVHPHVAVVELDREPDDVMRLVRNGGQTAVVFVADRPRADRYREAARRAGALDVLARPIDVNALGVAITSLLRACVDRQVAVGDLMIDDRSHVARRAGAELFLTPTQFLLLVEFVHHADDVLTKRQLLSAVWGFDALPVNLVEVHVSALRRKLEEHGPRMIQTVRGLGYVMRAPPDGAHCSATGHEPSRSAPRSTIVPAGARRSRHHGLPAIAQPTLSP